MKLKFKEQQYQIDATNAVVKCFLGQKKGFRQDYGDRFIKDKGTLLEKVEIEEMFSNKELETEKETILKNIQDLQKEQGLKVSKKLD